MRAVEGGAVATLGTERDMITVSFDACGNKAVDLNLAVKTQRSSRRMIQSTLLVATGVDCKAHDLCVKRYGKVTSKKDASVSWIQVYISKKCSFILEIHSMTGECTKRLRIASLNIVSELIHTLILRD